MGPSRSKANPLQLKKSISGDRPNLLSSSELLPELQSHSEIPGKGKWTSSGSFFFPSDD
jgi:hypothetical protein